MDEELLPNEWEVAERNARRRRQRAAEHDEELARARAALARVVGLLGTRCFRAPDGRLALYASDVLRAVAATPEEADRA